MKQYATNDEKLRETFDNQAELYNRMRPRYPREIFDALIEATGLNDDARLLEIGPGTGQATRSFAEYRYNIVTIELGVALAKIARRELSKYKNVEVVTGAFEDVQFSDELFDLIYSATAFHWVNDEVKFTKSHSLLKQGGHLAVIHRNHLAGDNFYTAVIPIYRKYKEDRPKSTKDSNSLIMNIDDIKENGILDKKYFKTVYHHVFPHSMKYTADEYVKLTSTYSPTLAMSQEKRDRFLGEIHNLINNEFDGEIIRNYGISLTIGKKI